MRKAISSLILIVLLVPTIALTWNGILSGDTGGGSSWTKDFTGTVTVGEKVTASITDFAPATGTYYPGQSVTSSLRFKNTGNVRRTFYVGYSVQDKNGKWYDSPTTAVTLDPGVTSADVGKSWTVPSSPVTGWYRVVMAVWKTNPDTDPNPVRLDSRDKSNSFRVGLPPTIESFSITVTAGEMKEVKVKITNPNDFSITITRVEVIDKGGFIGSVTIVSYPSSVAANGYGSIEIRVTPDNGCPKGTYTIKFRATGGP